MSSVPFQVFAGDDEYLVDREASEAYGVAAAEAVDPTSIEIVDGRAQTVDEAETAIDRFISAIQTRSMFGDRKVVWFQKVSFLGDNRVGSAEGTLMNLERLRKVLEKVTPAEVTVIISVVPIDRRRSFQKWLLKAGGAKFIETKKDAGQAFAAIVREEAQRLQVKVGAAALHYLRYRLNGNTRMVVSEIAKLADYVGEGGEITPELVVENVPEFGESEFFEPVEKFYQNTLPEVLESIRRYFFTHKEARPLLAALLGRNRLLIQLRALGDAGDLKLPIGDRGSALTAAGRRHSDCFVDPEEKNPLNVFSQNQWYAGMLSRSAVKFKLKRLVDFQEAFIEGFRELIQRPHQQEEVIRELAVRCLGGGK